MKKELLTLILFLTILISKAQTLSLVSPEGLQEPYEISPGTSITLKWDYSWNPPTTIFSYHEYPSFPDFGIAPEWNQHTNFVDNFDGTYSITFTVQETTYFWGGNYAEFISSWNFSNVLDINILSPVSIVSTDGLLCYEESDTELLSSVDTYESYQWYYNNEPIDGANESSYSASKSGNYKVQVPYEGDPTFSNTIKIALVELSISGKLSEDGTELTLDALGTGMNTYQWFSGIDENSLEPIDGAEEVTYTALIEEDQMHYVVQGAIAGCKIESGARAVSSTLFSIPELMVQADTNDFDLLCSGALVTLSVSDNYTSYQWYKDGFETYGPGNSIEISQEYQEGNYSVGITTTEWPEIVLKSNEVMVDYFSPIQPQLSGVSNYGSYCEGEQLSITLSDEGYVYDWYVHENYTYTDNDKIEVDGTTYNFEFLKKTNITVTASHKGCESSNTFTLNSYSDESIYLNVSNYDQVCLCPDSTVTISIPSYLEANYHDFHWYQITSEDTAMIEGQVSSSLEVTTPGTYQLSATNVNCAVAEIKSSPYLIKDYTEQPMYVYADSYETCDGDTTVLYLSGGSNWINIQWFQEDIVIGDTGYEEDFIPIPGSGSESTQEVSEWNSYRVKAKHQSCPNGLKLSSEIINIKPSLNPTISVDHYTGGELFWHLAPYDSIPDYTYCLGETVVLSIPDEYTSYQWYSLVYAGDDDYELGEAIEGANEHSIEVIADGVEWFTVLVDLDDCTGASDPVLIDTYVFASPAITSYDNSELCSPQDSTLLNISFPGSWVKYEWFVNGELLPDSDNDSIYATVPGLYTVTAFPELCPDFGLSSGTGPIVSILEAQILENDTVIYATPFMGYYEYQWYLDGTSIDAGDYGNILFKSEMANGNYSVEVTNTRPCVSSASFIWNATVPEIHDQSFSMKNNAQDGAEIGTVVANDQDGDALIFTFTESNEVVGIDSQSGLLSLKSASALSQIEGSIFSFEVVVVDPYGARDSASISINITTVLSSGLYDKEILAYPNPTTDKLYIAVDSFKGGEMSLYNLSGALMLKKIIKLDIEEIEMERLPEGVYLMVISQAGKVTTIKVTKAADFNNN
ncbi:MAG: T9SS type A sorting domain-containing protein [Marinoscillum sp.]